MGTPALNRKSLEPDVHLSLRLFGSAEASFGKQSKIKSAFLLETLLTMGDLSHRKA
jgi:hypothetical protein